MPLYQFRDISTGEEWEEFCSMATREEILKNPNIQQIIHAPAIVSGIQGISYKTDNGFREVLSKVSEAHPSSPLADKTLQRGVKETKTRLAAEKHRLK